MIQPQHLSGNARLYDDQAQVGYIVAYTNLLKKEPSVPQH